MLLALSATARLTWQTYLLASTLISSQLLRRAKRGARGKAHTKMVMKPNCSTEHTEKMQISSEKQISSKLLQLNTIYQLFFLLTFISCRSEFFSSTFFLLKTVQKQLFIFKKYSKIDQELFKIRSS